MSEAFNLGHYGRAGYGEEVRAVESQGLAEELDDGALIHFVFELEADWCGYALRLVFLPMFSSRFQCVEYELALYGAALFRLFMNGKENLFPEPRHGAHACGSDFLQRLQNVLWPLVDSQCGTACQAQFGPCPLEDVRVGKEVYDEVLLADVEGLVVCGECGTVL